MIEKNTQSDERTEQIAAAAGLTVTQVRDLALADWPEGDEHQAWLDTAPVPAIASWLNTVAEPEED